MWKSVFNPGTMMHMSQRVEISQKSIMFAIFVLLGFFLLHRLRDILVLVFLCMIFASALNPIVRSIQKYLRFPRSLAILFVYVIVISIIATLTSFVIPPLIRETASLIMGLHLPQLPDSLDLSKLQFTLEEYNSIMSRVGTSIPSLVNAVFSTFSGLLVVFTFLVITYYLLVERDHLHHYLVWTFGHTSIEKRAKDFVDRIENELGGWVRAELVLMFVIGLMTYIGLTILGVPYAFPLAILAGVLETVPNIGPTISSVPAIILAFFTISPAMALATALLYILIQQLENNLIVPKIMAAAVNISPLIAILTLIIGLKLGGVAGAILAIPLFIFFRAIVREFYQGRNPLRTLEQKEA